DDQPANNAYEQRTLAALGMRLDLAASTAEALGKVGRAAYDVILSDMARDTPDAGLVLLRRLREGGCRTEVVFYVGRVDPSRPAPLGAFGIAGSPEPLLHYVFDVLERRRVSRPRHRLSVACPHCRRTLAVGEAQAAALYKCAACGGTFTLR